MLNERSGINTAICDPLLRHSAPRLRLIRLRRLTRRVWAPACYQPFKLQCTYLLFINELVGSPLLRVPTKGAH